MPAVMGLERSADVVFPEFLLTKMHAHNSIIGPEHPVWNIAKMKKKKMKMQAVQLQRKMQH